MIYETIMYEKRGRISYITLNRPKSLNAINIKMMRELKEVWRVFEHDEEAWVAIVSGAGRAFCSGADVKDIEDGSLPMAKTAREELPEIREIGWGPLWLNVSKPTIAAIHGICCGGGLDFATECDIVIAAEDAQFFDPHVSIGVVACHESIQLSRRIPIGEALRIALMGTKYKMSARRALELGLVSELVPQGQLMSHATEIAQAVIQQAPLAVRGTKQCILSTRHMSLREAVEYGEYIRRENMNTEDSVEGARAFIEKRPPAWKGK